MSNSAPSWLPVIIELPAFNGDVGMYLEHLYGIFRSHFVEDRPLFCSLFVHVSSDIVDGKHKCFLHITSQEDYATGERNTDLRRCERLPWIRPLIENQADEQVCLWEKPVGRDHRIFLFLENNDFLVVLTKTKYCYYLTTAYHVDYPASKMKYMREYNAYKAKTAG